MGNASAVATDSQQRVYVFQRKDPPVLIFGPGGNYLGSWGCGPSPRLTASIFRMTSCISPTAPTRCA